MEEARRRLQEKQDAKAAKFIEDKVQVNLSKTLNYMYGQAMYHINKCNSCELS